MEENTKKVTELTVCKNKISAVALAMPFVDIRFYLCGVNFECVDGGDVIATATDGHRCHVCVVGTWQGDKQDFIMKADHVKVMIGNYKSKQSIEKISFTSVVQKMENPNKGKVGEHDFIYRADKKITFSYKEMWVTVEPLDDVRYLNWRNLFYKKSGDLSMPYSDVDIVNQYQNINPLYVADVYKALSFLGGGKGKFSDRYCPKIMPMSKTETENLKPVIFHNDSIESKFIALVMPIRRCEISVADFSWFMKDDKSI